MFTKQIGTLIQSLMGAGMPARLADQFSMLGNCQADLKHNGPITVEYEWPPNADLDNHAALTLRTQGTAINIPQGNIVLGPGVNLALSSTSEIITDGGSALSSYKVAKLDADLLVGGSATAKVQSWNGSDWVDKVPEETITVVTPFLTGDELLTQYTLVGVHRTDQGIYVVGDAQAN